jgi:hypothetical protein
MAEGRDDLVVAAKVFVDRLGLAGDSTTTTFIQ